MNNDEAFRCITDMLLDSCSDDSKIQGVLSNTIGTPYGTQILLDPERKLLETLTKEYDAGLLFFQPYSESWCVVSRNKNIIIATFLQHMFTLCIGDIYCIDDLLYPPTEVDFSTINKYPNSPHIKSPYPITSGIGRTDKEIHKGETTCLQEKK
ncbi:MAG: hypothetical protein M0P49_03975 [Bacilli bacterium]|nr:hypothetical protein [Bacilli bacterium]